MTKAQFRTRSVSMNVDTGEKTWITPIWLIRSLGHFDTDPCVPDAMPWKTADRMITKEEDGLKATWKGRVWLNPPYGSGFIEPFMTKMAHHRGGGIALVYARFETDWFQDLVFPFAKAILFMKRRISFCRQDGRPSGHASIPSCLVAYSQRDVFAIERSRIEGFTVKGAARNG